MIAKYRHRLPQLDCPFLTDGGLETTLIFHQGIDLPDFAAFGLLKTEAGRESLRGYYRPYLELARSLGVGFILESATWRAKPDWTHGLGYADHELVEANRAAIALLVRIREEYETDRSPMVISGCIGPRGDGYVPSALMSAVEAERYHAAQIDTFSHTAADMVSAVTINYVEEAIGITRAAGMAGMPAVISFTVETDGKLPTGHTLQSAVEQVDEATHGAPAYYMINCAHPTHLEDLLARGGAWLDRIRGFRANASAKSHAELNDSTELDAGDPAELVHPQTRLSMRHGKLWGEATPIRASTRGRRACGPGGGPALV